MDSGFRSRRWCQNLVCFFLDRDIIHINPCHTRTHITTPNAYITTHCRTHHNTTQDTRVSTHSSNTVVTTYLILEMLRLLKLGYAQPPPGTFAQEQNAMPSASGTFPTQKNKSKAYIPARSAALTTLSISSSTSSSNNPTSSKTASCIISHSSATITGNAPC